MTDEIVLRFAAEDTVTPALRRASAEQRRARFRPLHVTIASLVWPEAGAFYDALRRIEGREL